MKRLIFLITMAAALMAASCSSDERDDLNRDGRIGFSATFDSTRAVSVTEDNLTEFWVTALRGNDTYFSDVEFSGTQGNPYNSGSPYYWPDDDSELGFYAYYPNDTLRAASGANPAIVPQITSDTRQLTVDFTPASDISNQVDFITATATGTKSANAADGVPLHFGHRLSQIEIKAKSTGEGPTTYKIKGLRIVNPVSKGTFNFADNTWSLDTEVKSSYKITYAERTLRSSPISLMDTVAGSGTNNAMLIPQQLSAWADNNTTGAYLELNVDDGGGYKWTKAPIDTEWEAGKKYTYTVDFQKGGGTSPIGDSIKIVVGDSDTITMIKVNGGTFWMGADTNSTGQNYDADALSNESPVHQVTLSDYWIGKYEVTQGVWEAVMGTITTQDPKGDNYPVASIKRDSICNLSTGFLKKLNDLTVSQRGDSLEFRLPTEAEWEFAARGGNKSNGYKYSGSREIDAVAWYYDNSDDGNGRKKHPVGQKQPNELGIYDMTGNVHEWCSDWYGAYGTGPDTNPPGPPPPDTKPERVLRGGAYNEKTSRCRVTFRHHEQTTGYFTGSNIQYGFRLASSSNPTSTASASAAKPKIEVTVEVQVIKD